MSLHEDLLRQARLLAVKEPKRPLQASLRRAVSASYYALFHLFVDEATGRMFSGEGRTALRHCLARAFVHSDMKKVAQQFSVDHVSPKLAPGLNDQALQPELVAVARVFVDLQQARHEADYDTARRFSRREVLDLLDEAEQAFAGWRHVGSTKIRGVKRRDRLPSEGRAGVRGRRLDVQPSMSATLTPRILVLPISASPVCVV